MTQELAPIDEKFRFTPTGLEIVGRPTFEECEMVLDYTWYWGKMAPIYFGDMLNYIESRWGDGYAQALDPTGYKYQTAANRKSVTKRVPQRVRQPESYFSHLSAVASLPEPQQERILKKAAKKGWQTSDIKLEAKKVKRKHEEAILPVQVKLELTFSLHVPENWIDKLRELARSWASRLRQYDVELLDIQVKRIP